MKPKVSVITGYYRRAGVVERTLSALLGQTMGDIEVIVFDDCSQDGTADAIADFARKAKDPRLKPIYHDKNIGFVNGLIRWIPTLSGEYIAIQGSGDVSLPRRLEMQSKVLDDNPDVVLVGCYYTNIVEDTGVRRPRKPDASGMTFERLLKGNVFSHGEVMYRRAAYDKAGGYRAAFRFNQDYDLWLRMIRLGSFHTVKENLYDRYVSFDGVSYDPAKFVRQVRYSVISKNVAVMEPQQAEPILAELLADGPMRLVPNSHPEVQDKIWKGAIRSLVWGHPSEARQIARNLEVLWRRGSYKAADWALTGPLSWIFRPTAHRILGVKS